MMIDPDDIDALEMYDGPTPGMPPRPNGHAAPPVAPPAPIVETRDERYAQAFALALDVLSARLLGLVAMTGAIIVFVFLMIWPDMLRLYGAVAYCGGVIVPMTVLYVRRG